MTTIHFQFCCSRIGDVLLKFCKFDNDVDGDNDTNHNDDNDDDNNNNDDAAAAFFQKFCRILKIIWSDAEWEMKILKKEGFFGLNRVNMDGKKGDGFTRNHPILMAVVITQG